MPIKPRSQKRYAGVLSLGNTAPEVYALKWHSLFHIFLIVIHNHPLTVQLT
jgi:hypothetical protein